MGNPSFQCQQWSIDLGPFKRGAHLVTELITAQCSQISSFDQGILHLFLQHTSASLTINENCDPSVRADFETHLNLMVPENASHYTHTEEGPDDMPGHLKSSLLGHSLQIPLTKGQLNLGLWQGIYLFEHRNRASRRSLIATAIGSIGKKG